MFSLKFSLIVQMTSEECRFVVDISYIPVVICSGNTERINFFWQADTSALCYYKGCIRVIGMSGCLKTSCFPPENGK